MAAARGFTRLAAWPAAASALVLLFAGCTNPAPGAATRGAVRIAVVGTNDVHGQLLPGGERGGLTTVSGYVDALRRSGEVDAVVLVDGGDMWQGTLDSNLDEGASVVAAYNAMGYAAAAIGNHEFDFGPEGPASVPVNPSDDARGALKARAREAAFPLLAANLVDEQGRRPPGWDNVQASAEVRAAGVDVGIVGIMTADALSATIAANVAGLEVTPLADAVRREAESLRRAGADIVIVAAHAGGRCTDFTDPADTGSCEAGGEIFALAEALPPGLVDHIVAGHVHHSLAHVVNGISITSNDARTPTFGRVDFVVAPDGTVSRTSVHAPTPPCPYRQVTGECAWSDPGDGSVLMASYAGRPVVPDPAVVAIADQAHAAAERQKNEPLGVVLAEPFTLKGNPESALANLVTEALLDSFDADVALHNVHGGLRAVLPAGELEYGSVYEMFPFDNRVVIVELSGAALREIMAGQARKGRTRAGIAGLRVSAACTGGDIEVTMALDSGRAVADGDRVRMIVNDFLAFGGDGILVPAMPAGGFAVDDRLPRMRDALVEWFRRQDRLHPEDFSSAGAPRWRVETGCVDPAAAGH